MAMIKRRDNSGVRIKPPHPAPGSTNQEKPHFSLVHLQEDFSLRQCRQEEKAAFADTLDRLSKLTWGEIQSSPRYGLGHEAIARDAIKAPIPSVITQEVRILSFRCHGMAPMVGFRDGIVFHVVWLDRKFTLYDHGG